MCETIILSRITGLVRIGNAESGITRCAIKQEKRVHRGIRERQKTMRQEIRRTSR